MKIKSRFYYDYSIKLEDNIILKDNIFHHLVKVLRTNVSDYISLYNEKDGEFSCIITSISKSSLNVLVKNIIRTPNNVETTNKGNIICAFAPLKKEATDFVLEKGTELNYNGFINIITERTVNKPFDITKASIKVELASNQCNRLDVPVIYPPLSLKNLLLNIQYKFENYKILWLHEKKKIQSIKQIFTDNKISNVILLIGPEGGFSANEVDILNANENIIPIHLPTNILRAETAALAGIIYFQLYSC